MRRLPAFLLVTLLSITPGLYGQQAEELQLPGEGDVRIIVDISGSMKGNDPNNLRQPAVRLLARMIPEGAEAGVWTFGQWVNMLVPHGEVNDAWSENAVAQSRKINSVALRTNLGEAIEKASDPYLSGADLSTTDFILLTDGQVDLADDPLVNEAERQRIMGPLLDGLIDRGATLHTVALSQEADLDMLGALAAKSGGHFSLASSAEELSRAFLKSLNAAVPQDQIPLNEEGFKVDSGVEEFTALIFWGEGETSATRSLELIDPAGQSFSKSRVADNMRWAAETGYDLITVTAPDDGQWQVNGELGEGSRVTVVSDLRMVVSPVPPTFTADKPILLKIAFFEEDSRIENPDFLKVIDVIVRLTSSDGLSGSKTLNQDKPPSDGVYTDNIPSLPAAGDYSLEVIADGTTFSRRFSAVTRFIAPESADPVAEPQPATEAPAQQPESTGTGADNEEPAMEPVEQAGMSQNGPIDISSVEEPASDQSSGKQADEPDAQSAIPLWVWGASGGLLLLVIGGGIWFWLRRKKAAGGDETEETEQEPEPEPEQEPEPEPETEQSAVSEEDIPELDAESVEEPEPEDDEVSTETGNEPEEDSKEEVPELEPEAEDEPVSEAEADETPDAGEETNEDENDDDEEFGLEDFDLSEFDDLPEDGKESNEEDPKKGE